MNESTTDNRKKPAAMLWYSCVDKKQMRIRLLSEQNVGQIVAWLRSETKMTVDCLAVVGPKGQIVIRPSSGATLPSWRAAEKSLEKKPAAIGEEGSPVVEVTRYQAAARPVKVSYDAERKRYTIRLSADLAKAEIGPKKSDPVAVFACGNILEVWKIGDLRNNLRQIADDMEGLDEEVQAAVEERDEEPADSK